MQMRRPPFVRSGGNASQRIVVAIVLVAVLLAIQYAREKENGGAVDVAPRAERPAPASPAEAPRGEVAKDSLPDKLTRIERVIDGDTLLLPGGERVRLIGVDTPETVKENAPVEPWGPEASAFTKKFLASKSARLEYDIERRDHYGRTLAYVWVKDRMLNEELIRQGLARALRREPYSEARKQQFIALESEARRAKVGMWSQTKSRQR